MNVILVMTGAVLSAVASPTLPDASQLIEAQAPAIRVTQAKQTCGSVSSCREAVILWCGGYSRADGDNDGIPCENVCTTLEEVEEIREEIGC